ncbi:hypothetical protein HAZT_HAZT006864 [Hyalella azteca]|nr:hypothetical protein HAZT_HAZT006864 [Hyalella azteca]
MVELNGCGDGWCFTITLVLICLLFHHHPLCSISSSRCCCSSCYWWAVSWVTCTVARRRRPCTRRSFRRFGSTTLPAPPPGSPGPSMTRKLRSNVAVLTAAATGSRSTRTSLPLASSNTCRWLQVPKSCCMTSSSGNLLDCETAPNNNTAYAVGCYADAKEMVEYYGLIIGGVGVIIALLMLLGLVFSMVLFKMIN